MNSTIIKTKLKCNYFAAKSKYSRGRCPLEGLNNLHIFVPPILLILLENT